MRKSLNELHIHQGAEEGGFFNTIFALAWSSTLCAPYASGWTGLILAASVCGKITLYGGAHNLHGAYNLHSS